MIKKKNEAPHETIIKAIPTELWPKKKNVIKKATILDWLFRDKSLG